jgi:predicted nucleotidyltransferase
MVTLDTLRREKKAEIIRLAEMRGCRNVRVFGSVATGENRPDSDVDFLVDLESGRTIFDLARFLGDLRDLLGTDVDVVERRSIHPYVRDRVLAEAIGLWHHVGEGPAPVLDPHSRVLRADSRLYGRHRIDVAERSGGP